MRSELGVTESTCNGTEIAVVSTAMSETPLSSRIETLQSPAAGLNKRSHVTDDPSETMVVVSHSVPANSTDSIVSVGRDSPVIDNDFSVISYAVTEPKFST